VDKGYWQAAPETAAALRDASAQAAQQIAAEEKAEMETLREAAPLPALGPAPTPTPQPAPTPPPATLTPPPAASPPPPPQPQQVEGKALEDISQKSQPPAASSASADSIPPRLILALAAIIALFAFGWFRQARRL
jgi:cobalamin biosynthesis Mg chelatase CobN